LAESATDVAEAITLALETDDSELIAQTLRIGIAVAGNAGASSIYERIAAVFVSDNDRDCLGRILMGDDPAMAALAQTLIDREL
jgi:hypothetical protein